MPDPRTSFAPASTGISSALASYHSPFGLAGLNASILVSAGGAHTCALLEGGRVACWGFNMFGQLGIGTTSTTSLIPTVVEVGGECRAILMRPYVAYLFMSACLDERGRCAFFSNLLSWEKPALSFLIESSSGYQAVDCACCTRSRDRRREVLPTCARSLALTWRMRRTARRPGLPHHGTTSARPPRL